MVNGAMDGKMYLAWIKVELAPTLKSGDIAVIDLATHKISNVKKVIETVEACLEYLPPDSPDR